MQGRTDAVRRQISVIRDGLFRDHGRRLPPWSSSSFAIVGSTSRALATAPANIVVVHRNFVISILHFIFGISYSHQTVCELWPAASPTGRCQLLRVETARSDLSARRVRKQCDECNNMFTKRQVDCICWNDRPAVHRDVIVRESKDDRC